MATINSYDAGSLVQVSISFVVGGVATDPGAVTLSVQKPDGTTTTPTALKSSTGNYYAQIDTTGGPEGMWLYKFSGTVPAQAAADGQFFVKVPF